jgi:hypothetical protein
MLAAHPEEDAGHIIAKMLLQRQIQKQETKKAFALHTPKTGEDEVW